MKKLYYVKTSDSEQRSYLKCHLMNAGYEIESDTDKERYFKVNLPIWVDLIDGKYGVMGNVTCAASASAQNAIIEYSDFIKIFTKYLDEKEKNRIDNKLKEAKSKMVPGLYYLLDGNLVSKRTLGDNSVDLIFECSEWKADSEGLLVKKLSKHGDEYEISEKEALNIITDQAINYLIYRWKEKYAEEYEEWEKAPQWWAKLVETRFVLNGIEKSLVAGDFGWSDGFFESVQKEIESDLEEYGAVITYSYGMMD